MLEPRIDVGFEEREVPEPPVLNGQAVRQNVSAAQDNK
jgi:hypothetical protein